MRRTGGVAIGIEIRKALRVLLTLMLMNVSAYTAAPEETGRDDGLTASGTIAEAGRTVAADHLPFGTVVIVNGCEYVVEDTFGAGYSDRLDIFMTDADAAWEFGRKWMLVEVIEE